jgi:hypothetical protein
MREPLSQFRQKFNIPDTHTHIVAELKDSTFAPSWRKPTHAEVISVIYLEPSTD